MNKTIVMVMLSLLATGAGCKKGEDKGGGGSAPVVNASPECKEAGERVQELLLRNTKADAPDSEKAAAFGKARTAGDQVAGACTKDKWSAEAIACMKAAETVTACNAKLTPEQQKGLPASP
jgi:hypothetical protein